MSGFTGHVVRRALEPTMNMAMRDMEDFEFPTWGVVLLASTLSVFVFALIMVSHILRLVCRSTDMISARSAMSTVISS